MSEPLTPDLVDDLRAEFDQGHFIDWEAVVPFILARERAALTGGQAATCEAHRLTPRCDFDCVAEADR